MKQVEHRVTSQPTRQQDLRLAGAISYFVDQQRLYLALDGIANDRASDNLSGTLSLELWALDAPYQGGFFHGECLAAIQIGELQGKHWLPDCEYELNFHAAQSREVSLCLMLREWNGVAFETRDYRNFQHGLMAAKTLPSPLQPVPTAEVISIEKGKKKKPGKRHDKAMPVCVNSASEKELAALKGLSKKVAKALIEARPFSSLNELTRVKGLGKKTLEKLREKLKV